MYPGLLHFKYNITKRLETLISKPRVPAFRAMQASTNAIIFDLSAWSFLACEPHPHLQKIHSRGPHLLLAAENGHDALSVEQFLIADGYTRLNNGPIKLRRLGARKVMTDDISSFVANIDQDSLP
jgi:hypothetical protein